MYLATETEFSLLEFRGAEAADWPQGAAGDSMCPGAQTTLHGSTPWQAAAVSWHLARRSPFGGRWDAVLQDSRQPHMVVAVVSFLLLSDRAGQGTTWALGAFCQIQVLRGKLSQIITVVLSVSLVFLF